jgi:hypothetical protein
MAVARKFNVSVKRIPIDELKELAPTHGDHLFRGGEAAIVAHDPPDETGSQQHVRPLNQKDFGPLFSGRERGSAS